MDRAKEMPRMPYKVPRYPDELTSCAWHRQRDSMATQAEKATMGHLLRQLERAFEAVNWRHTQLVQNVPPSPQRTPRDIEGALNLALDQKFNLNALKKACRAVEKTAGALADKWAREPHALPASIQALRTIASSAKGLNQATSFHAVLAAMAKERQAMLDELSPSAGLKLPILTPRFI
jgi:hypothetical protein